MSFSLRVEEWQVRETFSSTLQFEQDRGTVRLPTTFKTNL